MVTKKTILVPMGTKVPKWGPTWEQCFWGLFPMLVTPPTLVIWDRKSHFGTLDPHPQNNVQSYHANVFSRTSEAEPGRITLKKPVHFLPRHPPSRTNLILYVSVCVEYLLTKYTGRIMGVLILMNHCSAHYASGAEHHGIASHKGDIYSADNGELLCPQFWNIEEHNLQIRRK